MPKPYFYHIVILWTAGFLVFSCTKSSDQRRFEEQGFSTPENITEMTADGNPVENRTDPDDWRIGPMFQGLIDITTPAYPNPVSLNAPLEIDIDVKGIESIKGLVVFVFSNPDNIEGPIFMTNESELSPGIITVRLDPAQFSQVGSGGQASNLYRILIFDRQENLISYGDVQVI